MIHGFPVPYPDEAFYSLVARRGARFRYPSHKGLLQEVFGTTDVIATIEFPAPLAWLQGELHSSHPCADMDSLVANHTLLPWYAPFLPVERVTRLRESMLHGDGKGAWAWVGILAGRVKAPRFLRFCPECCREDIAAGRSLYWRRLHQLTGIDVCPVHKVYLENSTVLRRDRATRHSFEVPTAELAETKARFCDHHALVKMAVLGSSLLSGNYSSFGLDLRPCYHRLLEKHGLLTPQHNVRIEELARFVKDTFPADYLSNTGCSITCSDNWLTKLVRKPKAVHAPVKHLVLLCVLGGDISDLLTSVPVQAAKAPLGSCRNPVCAKAGISPMNWMGEEYSPDLRAYVDSFRCGECGGVWASCSASKDKVWVKDYGSVWKKRLVNLWLDPDQSLRGLARVLGVDPMTAKRQALKAGLPFPRLSSRPTTATGLKPLKADKPVDGDREEWRATLRTHPGVGVKRLRMKCPALYARLYRRDRAWLLNHSPKEQRRPQPLRVDWAQRDKRLSGAILLEAARLRQVVPPFMVSALALARAVGAQAWIQHKLSRLPRCRTALRKSIENRVDFACRRIDYVVQQALASGIRLKEWQILKQAGIRPELRREPKVRHAVRTAVLRVGLAAHSRLLVA